jgi:hypothetical protein
MNNRNRFLRLALIGIILISVATLLAHSQGVGELTAMAHGKTDKADTHGFTEIYDHILGPMRATAKKVCEIGIAAGGSLQVWSEYFSAATIYGIDIYSLTEIRSRLRAHGASEEFLPKEPESGRLRTFIADQANREQLKSFIDKYGAEFDLILDDGGHSMQQQQVSFGFFFKYVKPGGYYIIEDVHTSLAGFYTGYGAEANENNTTLTMINQYIRNSQMQSPYLTKEECAYLTKQIEYCNLFARNNNSHSITCIFRKKMDSAGR